MERAVYRCDDCGLELTLVGAVDKGCVSCGGNLSKVREYETPRYNHPMQAMSKQLEEIRQTQSRESAIEAIVALETPKMLAEIEHFLYSEAMMDDAGGNDYGEEEGMDY